MSRLILNPPGVRMNKNVVLCLLFIFSQLSCCLENSVNADLKKQDISKYVKRLKNKPCWIIDYRNCPKYKNDVSFFFDAAIKYETHDNFKKINDYQLKLALSKRYVSSLSSKIESEHTSYKECSSNDEGFIYCTSTTNHTIIIDAKAHILLSKIEIVERYNDVEEKTYFVLGKVSCGVYHNMLKLINSKYPPHLLELHDHNSCQDSDHMPSKKKIDQDVDIIWYQVNDKDM